MKTLIISGADGWLGKALVSRFSSSGLNDYEKVVAIMKDEGDKVWVDSLSAKANLETIFCDLTDPFECENMLSFDPGCDMIHTAGVIHPQRVADFYSINVNGVRNILKAARRANVEKIAVLSSNSVHGVSRDKTCIFTEESALIPYMHYGRSKLQMENEVKKLSSNFDQVSIIRAPWFYGPFQPTRQTQFFSMIKNGKFPLFGRADNLRSMVYIENLVDGILLSMRPRKVNFDTFWIADERPYSMLEIVQTVSNVLSKEFNYSVKEANLRLPNFVPQLAQATDFAMQSLGLYNQKIHVLSEMNKTIACDISKSKLILNYSPRVALYEGMQNSIAWLEMNEGTID